MRSFLFAGILGAGVMCFGGDRLLAAAPAGQPAQIHVTLPADATLTIDGKPTKSTSAERWFVTPPLARGKTFHYDFKAQFMRDGKNITVEQQVPVSAGRESNVILNVGRQSASLASPYRYEAGRAFYFGPETDEAAYPSSAFPTPGVRGYYVPYGGLIAGYSLGGERVPVGGFNPIHWGRDPSDNFYPAGR
jgi:uncharacterized protein (TIGR03000 family)